MARRRLVSYDARKQKSMVIVTKYSLFQDYTVYAILDHSTRAVHQSQRRTTRAVHQRQRHTTRAVHQRQRRTTRAVH